MKTLKKAKQEVADYAFGDILGLEECLSTPSFIEANYPKEWQQELKEIMRYVFHNEKRPPGVS